MVESTLISQETALSKSLADVQEARARIATRLCFVNRIPNEVLYEIFLRVIQLEDYSYFNGKTASYAPHRPFFLSQVCRHWRGVATSISALWTKVKLFPGVDQAAQYPIF